MSCLGVHFALTEKEVDRKSTRLNSSHQIISYAVFCLKKKKEMILSIHTPALTRSTAATPRPALVDSTYDLTTQPPQSLSGSACAGSVSLVAHQSSTPP